MEIMFLVRVFSFILVLQFSFTQVVRKGSCPNVQPQANFQPERFGGLWYKDEQYFYDVDFTYRCAAFSLNPHPDGSGNLVEDLYGLDVNSGKWVRRMRTLIPIPNQPGKIALQGLPGQTAEVFYILDTDYTNYAVVYYCKQSGQFLAEVAFIFSRQPDPLSQALKNRIYSKLSNSGIDPNKLVPQDKSCASMRPLPSAVNITTNQGQSQSSEGQVTSLNRFDNQQVLQLAELDRTQSASRIVHANPGQTIHHRHDNFGVLEVTKSGISPTKPILGVFSQSLPIHFMYN